MVQIGFIGAYDKKDLLLNICDILNYLGKKTLIVDATSMQRLRYIVPMVSNKPTITFVSEYHQIDVALGFLNLRDIAQYLGNDLNYDYVIIDTDNIQTLNYFMVAASKKVFFTTSYDGYDVKKGVEILNYIQNPIQVTKVILSADITANQENYLENLVKNPNITWTQEKVEFADEINNRRVTLQNQLSNEIKLKQYSSTYKDSLEYLISLIAENDISQSDIKRAIRRI